MQKYARRVGGERLSRAALSGVALSRIALSRARIARAGAAGTFALAALVAPSASAHIELIEPPPRYVLQDGSDNGIKSCPCGLGGSNRVCNVAADGSDPDRSERVSVFEAGSTITLRFQEFVNHAGRFRVAFDPDGADMADFNANILADRQDPANASGMMWEISVTLPDTTCDNCTLQLVQAMEVDQNTPIADPAPISSYYACADVRLVAPGSLGGEPAGDGEPEDPGTPGDMPSGDMPNDDMPSDDAPAGADPSDMGGEQPGGSDGDMSGGSQSADSMSGTPLIPAGSGTPTDSSGSTGTAPGAVAMNGAVGAPTGVPSGIGMAQPLPELGDPNAESSSSGCSLSSGESRGSAVGLGTLGVFALLGLRRSRRRG